MTNEILNSLAGMRLKRWVAEEIERLGRRMPGELPGEYDDAWANVFLEGQIHALRKISLRLLTDEEAAEAERVRFEMFGTPR